MEIKKIKIFEKSTKERLVKVPIIKRMKPRETDLSQKRLIFNSGGGLILIEKKV